MRIVDFVWERRGDVDKVRHANARTQWPVRAFERVGCARCCFTFRGKRGGSDGGSGIRRTYTTPTLSSRSTIRITRPTRIPRAANRRLDRLARSIVFSSRRRRALRDAHTPSNSLFAGRLGAPGYLESAFLSRTPDGSASESTAPDKSVGLYSKRIGEPKRRKHFTKARSVALRQVLFSLYENYRHEKESSLRF